MNDVKINTVPNDVTYSEIERSLMSPAEKTAKNYDNWAYECIKSITGDDLSGKTTSELYEYFGEDKPIMTACRGGIVNFIYKNHIFSKRRSELEEIWYFLQ